MARWTGYGAAACWTTTGAAAVVTLLCCIAQCSHAKSVEVGGAAGWTSYESSHVTAPNYGAWASSQKFVVGDSLVFKFAAGAHNVWLMKSQAAYQNCDFSGATLLDEGNSGFYTWTATQPGGFFFSCDKGAEGVGTHCNYNQKLAILVSKTATTPTSAPSPVPVKAPSPAPVKAPSPAPVKAPSPSPSPLPPSPYGFTAPAPAHSPISTSPVHAPAPSHAPWTAPAPAPAPPPFPSLPPSKPPIASPSPLLSPSPVPAPAALVPAPAPVKAISPGPSPSISPSSGPMASTPLALTPDVSSPPLPDLPEVPGGGPASDSPTLNAGMLLSAQSWSSLVHSVILLCAFLW